MADDVQVLFEDTRAELERARVQLQLIDDVVAASLERASAIGGELRLAMRIRAIREHKL